MSKLTKRLTSIIYLEFLKKFFIEAYIIILPAIALTLETQRTQIQLSLPIFLLSMLISQLIAGPLSDYSGRQKTILTLLPLFILGNAICASINNLTALYVGIVLVGLGIGAAPTLGKAIIYDISAHAKKAASILVLTSYAVVWSPAIGMAAGGSIAHYFSWRWIFAANIFLGVFAFIICASFLKNIEGSERKEKIRHHFFEYFYHFKRRKTAFRLLATGALTSGIIVYYAVTTFLYHTSLGFSLSTIGFLAFFIVASNIIGKTITLSLLNYLKLSTINAIGVFISLASSLLMILLALYSKQSVIFILLPMALYTIGVGIFIPSMRAKIASLGKQVGVLSSATSITISFFAVIGSTIAAHMNIITALPLAIMLLALSGLAMIFVIIARV